MSVLTAPYYGQNTDIDQVAELVIGTGNSGAIRYGLVLKAHPGNTGIIYIGLSDQVTANNGYPLAADDEMTISPAEAADADSVYAIASADNQKLSFRLV